MTPRITTGTAILALTIALQGCATTPEPDPLAELNPAPAEEEEGLASNFVGPADLESAIQQAQMMRRAGDYQGAIRTISQLVLVAPDDPRVLGEYGKVLVAQGQTEDAIAFLNRAIELHPGDWTLYSAQGVAFDQAANYAAANVAYNRALMLQPGEPTVLSNAGLSRMQAGDLDNAERLLMQALESGGDNERISSNLALVRQLKASRAATPDSEIPAPSGNPAADNRVPDRPAAPAQVATPEQSGGTIESGEIPAPSRPMNSAVQALAADPTVMMQRIPEPDPVPAAPVAAPASEIAADEAESIEDTEDEAFAPPRTLSEQVTADASPPSELRRLNPTE